MLALPSGVPLELVQRASGHGMALKHYQQPGREVCCQVLRTAMAKQNEEA